MLKVPRSSLDPADPASRDQFNTAIYTLSHRYRGIEGGRKVIFLHPHDITDLGFSNGEHVDILTRWDPLDDDDDVVRRAGPFRIVEYNTPRGGAAANYPETNPQSTGPVGFHGHRQQLPRVESIVVSLFSAGSAATATGRAATRRAIRTLSVRTGPTSRPPNHTTYLS